MLGAVEFYDDLAVKQLGYSPKHVILLHEVDARLLDYRIYQIEYNNVHDA